MHLYELAENYNSIFNELEETEGELTPELAERLNLAGKDYDTKVENVALFVLQLESDCKRMDEEILRLKSRARSRQNKANWLRGYLQLQVENTGRKVETPRVTVSLQKSPESVVVENEEAIPWYFKKGQLKLRWEEIPVPLREVALVELDKVAIKESFAQGQPVPGVRLESKMSLRIK